VPVVQPGQADPDPLQLRLQAGDRFQDGLLAHPATLLCQSVRRPAAGAMLRWRPGALGGFSGDASVFLYGFDLLAINGTDMRPERLDDRRARLRQLLVHPDGIRFSDHHAGDGERMFAHACKLGLEGIVSKRRDAPYSSGRSKNWLKIKNPDSPAARRLVDVMR